MRELPRNVANEVSAYVYTAATFQGYTLKWELLNNPSVHTLAEPNDILHP